MNYWVVSGNVDNSRKTLEAWFECIRRTRTAVMGYSDQKPFGRAFKEKIAVGDLIIVAQGSNANKRLCLAGLASTDAIDRDLVDPPGAYDYYRKLEPSVMLEDDPAHYGLSFEGAAFGESHRVPSLYQLYPERNPVDRKIVLKMLELLGLDTSAFDNEKSGDELAALVEEFKKSYMDAGDGEYHRKLLLKGREEGRKNYEHVLQLQREGEEITDAVLYGLLPHQDTQFNRENGHWIHVAPSVTRDVKEWFEGAGWIQSSEWPNVARGLLQFIRNAVEKPQSFRANCRNFDESFPHKGFQVGMLSPILNALLPEEYPVVNNKPVAVINWLTGAGYRARIKDMPDVIESIKQWVTHNSTYFEPLIQQGLNVYDTFDIFCHWLKAVKKHPLRKVERNTRYEEFGRGSAHAAAKVFEKMFPDERNRKSAQELLTECILRAHARNSNSWEITLGPRYLMLNVGFVKVVRLHFRENRIYLLGSAFSGELREKYADIVTFSYSMFKTINEEVGKCIIAPSKFADIVPDLKYAVLQFIDSNAGRAKSSIWASSHSPGVLDYLREVTGREIPSPDYEHEVVDEAMEEEEAQSDVPISETSASSVLAEQAADIATNYWWLNANPKIWDIVAPPVGTRQTYTARNSRGNKRRVYRHFTKLRAGDLLLGYVASPVRQIVALCRVTRPLHHTDKGERFEFEKIEQFAEPVSLSRLRTVPELEKCEPLLNNQGSLFHLRAEEYETIRSIVDEVNEEVEADAHQMPLFTIGQCAEATGFPLARLQEWKQALTRKRQAVFYGPPGTGKTFVADHLARHIVGGSDGFVELIQFHPAYSYEEFMQGIRPLTDDKGGLVFDLKPGRFLSFCTRARACSGPCVLIIDEINRANLSRVFGELMYLLEYRHKDIPLAGGVRFCIPRNVFVIGTMNTADRSIALVDFALRRRFAFLELAPEYDILAAFQRKQSFDATGLIAVLRDVNTRINDKNFSLGISFFLVEELAARIESIWRMEIETYLEEFFYSQPEVVNNYRWESVKERIVP